MKNSCIAVLLTCLLLGCRKDSGDFIFEMVYPDINFEIPAGLGTFSAYVFEVDEMNSNIDFYLSSNSLDTAAILAINPSFARIQALDPGVDFEYIREISMRICPVGPEPCTAIDEVFFIDNFTVLEGDRIDLLPSLRNAKSDLTAESFKLEVVFIFNYITPYAVPCRLDFNFQALR